MLVARAASFAVRGRALVDGIDLALTPGALLVLVGPNGAGKSTLLRLLSGDLSPTSGTVELDGRNLADYPAAELARRRAVVSQTTALSFPFSVREVVLLGATVPGFAAPSARVEQTAADCIAAVGLDGLRDRLFTQLSGGERQRAHIARALLQLRVAAFPQPERTVLLLDEPTANLDFAHQAIVLDELDEARQQARSGRAVLAILHDLNLAAAFADEIVLLSRGRIAGRGKAVEVMRDDLLSAVYGCAVRTNVTPRNGAPFVLPDAQ
jgi:iron complex transport system ATP-binding protein